MVIIKLQREQEQPDIWLGWNYFFFSIVTNVQFTLACFPEGEWMFQFRVVGKVSVPARIFITVWFRASSKSPWATELSENTMTFQELLGPGSSTALIT